MNYFKINYIEISQNIGKFFLCKMTPKQLHTIANDNLSRYSDTENGIQRNLSGMRTKEIKDYLKSEDATFPNTIIICINNNPGDEQSSYKINTDTGTLEILSERGVANVLDGQHRLSGFSNNEELFELPVAIFFDLSLGEQAKIFSKINSTQTKVSLDLVYDLFSMVEGRSVEKTSYAIVRALSVEEDSPWFPGKIKTLTERSGDIAQGSFAKYIDKELISRGKPLENLFLEERDADLLAMLKNFFAAVRSVFPEEWENENSIYVLTKTTGFVGFMAFFKDLVNIAKNKKNSITFEFCESRIRPSKSIFKSLISDNYESGAKGQNKIRDILRSSLSEEEKSFLKIK